MQSASEDAFRELYNTYFGDVYRYVLQSVRNKEDVEDLVQEIFLQAYRNFTAFRGESTYKTWLFAIAHNHLSSMWRKLFRRKKIYAQYEKEVRADLQVMGAADDWERLLLTRQLTEALQQLPDHYREVVVLRFLHEFSVADTANILHTSESRVRVLTHRALLKLRQLWDQGGEAACQMIDSKCLNN
ncbi:MAG: RNA polymerase sigma factor [Tumebacillaceae bacterium]